MTRLAYVGRRVSRLVITVWAMFTLVFAYIVFSRGREERLSGHAVPAAPNDPVVTQYVDWLVWFLTIWDEPVMATIVEGLQYTAVYLVPGMVVAVVVGIGVRIYTVADEGDRLDRLTDGATLLAVSIPVFLTAYLLRLWLLPQFMILFDVIRIYDRTMGPFTVRNLKAALWPISVMGVYLLAIQSHYAGEELREYVSAEFVKTVRAKGASRWRVGRHIFRNAAIPLLTLFFTDMLGMVVVGVFVIEYVTHVPGVGELMISAAREDDTPLLLSLTVLIVLAGVLTNFAQDIAYMLFDPRVEFDE